MRPSVFIDTGVLLASVLPQDPDHPAALAFLDRVASGEWHAVHTSDYVLAEAWNFIRMKVKRLDVAEALHDLVFGAEDLLPLVDSVVRIHSGRFAEALERYRTGFETGLSFTDWTSLVAMEDAKIDQIATFDGPLRARSRPVAGLQ